MKTLLVCPKKSLSIQCISFKEDLFRSLKYFKLQSSRDYHPLFPTASFMFLNIQPGKEKWASPYLIKSLGEQRVLESIESLHLLQWHQAPKLRSEQHFCPFGEAAAFFFLPPLTSPFSLQKQVIVSSTSANIQSYLLMQIPDCQWSSAWCLYLMRLFFFLLGTFRYSSAMFWLPRKDLSELACGFLMAIPFAATVLSGWHHYVLNGWKH